MLWRWWLGLPPQLDPTRDIERAYIRQAWLDPVAPEAAVAAPNNRASGVDSGSWGEGDKRPRLEDVRDLVEGRVSPILPLGIADGRTGEGRAAAHVGRRFEGRLPGAVASAASLGPAPCEGRAPKCRGHSHGARRSPPR